MELVKTIEALQNAVKNARAAGKQIALVPTMGALHKGHLSLVKKACEEGRFVVVSIFVNPTQFNNPEDLRTYPRTLDADIALLSNNTSAAVAFAPSVEEIYPESDTRQFDFGTLSQVMEGKYRPGHFNGVAQIVSKLFMIVEPDVAFFGEKDFQQLAIIRQMVKDLKLNLRIVGCPIIRDDDGLATSSRNALLTPEGRAIAPKIHAILQQSVEEYKDYTPTQMIERVTKQINDVAGLEVEYYSIVDGLTLQDLKAWSDTNYAVGCVTVYCGKVRLIDNITYFKPKEL
ncbi:MAG: pantoate--beta-alanine ligase [Bacteroidales bacterium]|nr:pantoate--beta-alanine ligase [Bacteroidales bacterium]